MKTKHKQSNQPFISSNQNYQLMKIFPIRREPLGQLSFYPQSILIDDHFLDNIPYNSHSNKNLNKNKIIKFIGDKKQNIKMIIENIDYLQESQNKILMKQQKQMIEEEFSEILNFFYDKIQKIRKERNSYKNIAQNQKFTLLSTINSLHQEINQLKTKICCLQKQRQQTNDKLQLESKKKNFFQRENSIIKQKLKLGSLNSTLNPDYVNSSFEFVEKSHKQSFLISEDESRIKLNFLKHVQPEKSRNLYSMLNGEQQIFDDDKRIPQYQKHQLQLLLKKHNLQPDQLCKIIEEYLLQLKQYHEIEFQNVQEKRLYFLAKKMEDKIWNKKVKKDIERLMNIKQSVESYRKPLKDKKY